MFQRIAFPTCISLEEKLLTENQIIELSVCLNEGHLRTIERGFRMYIYGSPNRHFFSNSFFVIFIVNLCIFFHFEQLFK